MSAEDLFTRELWESVAGDLSAEAGRWWAKNKDALTEIGKDEARDIFAALRDGDTFAAKQEIVSRMSLDEWVAYRDGTTADLQGIARRRAELLDALKDIGRRAAKIVGRAVLAALGVVI